MYPVHVTCKQLITCIRIGMQFRGPWCQRGGQRQRGWGRVTHPERPAARPRACWRVRAGRCWREIKTRTSSS